MIPQRYKEVGSRMQEAGSFWKATQKTYVEKTSYLINFNLLLSSSGFHSSLPFKY